MFGTKYYQVVRILFYSSNYLTHGAFAQQMTHVIYTIYHIALFYDICFVFFNREIHVITMTNMLL